MTMQCAREPDLPDDRPQEILRVGRAMAIALARSQPDGERDQFARQCVLGLIHAYLDELGLPLTVEPPDIVMVDLPAPARSLVLDMGRAAASLDITAASYHIGGTYTAMLPADIRSKFGVFYTPPMLVARLLDSVTAAGIDWATCRVLDPACGGGAFLAPVVQRMAAALPDCNPTVRMHNIVNRIAGFEIDPFAAWMSRIFVSVALGAGSEMLTDDVRLSIKVCDALDEKPREPGFDLVVGNPPYGRMKLSDERRQRYQRSLFGHANIYGVFTDQALRLVNPDGLVALVTPASFLAGEYFKALRKLLVTKAPPISLDVVVARRGVFDDVLQETVLTVYRSGGQPGRPTVKVIAPVSLDEIHEEYSGHFQLPDSPLAPWMVPRSDFQGNLIEHMARATHRLSDFGYEVNTGPLVWNRHKAQLYRRHRRGLLPVVWAESITTNSRFVLRYDRHTETRWICVQERQGWLLQAAPCVLVQRTTSKEQAKRLNAALLPQTVIDKYGAVVVENHINMVRQMIESPPVSPEVLVAVLNTDVVDEAFRCLSGSVAVSAYELNAVPLPPPRAVQGLAPLLDDPEAFNAAVLALYGRGEPS